MYILIVAVLMAIPICFLLWMELSGNMIGDSSIVPGCLVIALFILALVALLTGHLVIGFQ